jgi:tetratricopeptide (TPR) repeat protein
LLPNYIPSSNLTRAGRAAGQGRGASAGGLLTATGRDAVQSVSLAKPVTPDIAISPATNLIPLSQALLQAADAIFASGDYQQAAAAYARLTVRYGNHDELAVRRFIALVASGDCDQAAVMFEAASATQQPLLARGLPAGGLAELYGAAAAERDKHVEYLAAYALKHSDDGLALAMVGTWLELDGQFERAQLFMKGAAALAPADHLPSDSARLVATDVSQ